MILELDLGELGYQECEAAYDIQDQSRIVVKVTWRGTDITDWLSPEKKSEIADELIEAIEQSAADRQMDYHREDWG